MQRVLMDVHGKSRRLQIQRVPNHTSDSDDPSGSTVATFGTVHILRIAESPLSGARKLRFRFVQDRPDPKPYYHRLSIVAAHGTS
jgi:hypothetical protein